MRIRIPDAPRRGLGLWLAAAFAIPMAFAQSPANLSQLAERLDRLERQNRELAAEVAGLKSQLAALQAADPPQAAAPAGPQAPPLEERVTVDEARIAEQAQSKMEASQRFPLRLTGMALFNTYLDSSASYAPSYGSTASPDAPSAGASFRQTVIGLDYSGPTTVWNGKVSGSLRMDFFGGTGRSLDQLFRLRTASVGVDWKSRSAMAGLEKPLIAVREPESLAQVGIPPLAGAGNLWMWIPQVRVEQDFHFSEQAGLRVQAAGVQTHEAASVYGVQYPPAAASYVEPSRPGFETRVEFFDGSSERRIEIAPGFHHSLSHAASSSIASDIFTVDWLVRPWQPVELTGTFFTGSNAAPLGGLQQGVLVYAAQRAYGVHTEGGWAQLKLRAGPRVWFNVFSGQQDDRNSDLRAGAIGKSLAYGANVFYRLAPNVLASFEAYQYRTSYLRGATLLGNHYDLALAYLF